MARYRILPEQSHVWIDARSSLHPIHSSTDGLEGFMDLELGPDGSVDSSAEPAGSVSLPVNRLSSGNRIEDRELYKRIDARRYPTINGVLAEMVSTGEDGRFKVAGDVTFRGVARRHEDEITISRIDDSTVRLSGAARFDVREFGMEPPRILMLRVEPEVEVRIEIVATKEA